MSTEAVTTSEIEGEILDRASVQSSLRKQLGLATDERRGALVREGERRYARYHLSVPLRPVPHVILNERGELADK